MKISKKAAEYMAKWGLVGFLGISCGAISYPVYDYIKFPETPVQISLAEKLDRDFRRSISIKDALDGKVLEQYREKAIQYEKLTDNPEYKKIKADWDNLYDQNNKKMFNMVVLSLGGIIVSGASWIIGSQRLSNLKEEERRKESYNNQLKPSEIIEAK
nr:hypothetical protein [Candidatus Woesearchaeota archaeon]